MKTELNIANEDNAQNRIDTVNESICIWLLYKQ